MPPLAVTTPELPNLMTPIRDRLKMSIRCPRLTELHYIVDLPYCNFEVSIVAFEVALSLPASFELDPIKFASSGLSISLLKVVVLHAYCLAGPHSLCRRYVHRRGVPADFAEAVKWLTWSADKGFAPAQYTLGYLLRIGWAPLESLQQPAVTVLIEPASASSKQQRQRSR